MKLRTTKLIFIGILLLVSIFTVSVWYSHGNLFGYGDEYWLADPSAFFKSLLYIWTTRYYSGGWTNFNIAQLFPITIFWVILKSLGFSLILIQFIWFVLMNFLPGLSAFYLIEYILKKSFTNLKNLYFSCLVGALFYSYNLVLVQLLPYQPHLKPVMIGAPLIVLFVFKYLNTRKSFKYAVYIALASLIFAQSNVNIAYTTPVFGLVFLILLYDVISKRKVEISHLKFLIETYLFIFLFNLWWIVPLFLIRSASINSIQSNLSTWDPLNTRQTFDYFRLIGFWAWDKYTDHYFYFPYHDTYDNLLTLICGFSFFATSLSALLFKPNKYTKFFFVLLVFGIFLVKGPIGPFGKLFVFLFSHLPLLWIFRDPFSKFSIYLMIAFGVLVSVFIQYLLTQYTDKRIKVATFVLPIIFVAVTAFPIFGGLFINRNNSTYLRSQFISIPSYWENYYKQQYSNMMIGSLTLYGSTYDWQSGFNGDPTILFTNDDLYKLDVNTFATGGNLFNEVYRTFIPHTDILTKKFISLFNVNKIADLSDLIYPDPVKNLLTHFYENNFKLIKNDGIKIFSIEDPTPEIYSVNKVIQTPDLFKENYVYGLSLYTEIKKPNYYSVIENPNKNLPSQFVSGFYSSINQVLDYKNLPQYLVTYINENNIPSVLYKLNVTNSFPQKETLKIKFNKYTNNGNIEPFHDFKVTILNQQGVVFTKDYNFSNSEGWVDLKDIELPVSEYYVLYSPKTPLPSYVIDLTKPSFQKNTLKQNDGSISTNSNDNGVVYEIPNFNSNKEYIASINYNIVNAGAHFLFLQNDNSLSKLEPLQDLFLCEQVNTCDGEITLKIEPQIFSKKAYFVIRNEKLFYSPNFGNINLHSIKISEVAAPLLSVGTSSNIDNNYLAVKYNKINPTKFEVDLSSVKHFPYILVFANSYFDSWKLKIDNNYLPESQHFQINGYANAWIINSPNTKAIIEFELQKYFETAVIISILSVLGLVCSVFIVNKYVKAK